MAPLLLRKLFLGYLVSPAFRRLLGAKGEEPTGVTFRLLPPASRPTRWTSYNEEAGQAIRMAAEEVVRRGHDSRGTDYLLFGLLQTAQGPFKETLKKLGLDTSRAADAIGTSARPSRTSLREYAKVLEAAKVEAKALGKLRLSPELLVLGICREPSCGAALFLNSIGVDLTLMAQQVRSLARNVPDTDNGLRPVPEVKTVHDAASAEVRRLGHPEINTGHLLLGLLKTAQGPFQAAIAEQGLSTETIIAAIEGELGRGEHRWTKSANIPTAQEFLDVLRAMKREAQARGLGTMTSALLLLATCQSRECTAAGILSSLGVDLDQVVERMRLVVRAGECC